jgi:hypothetical protein
MTNEPNVDELLRGVKRAIAIAKLVELEYQAYRLGEFVHVKLLPVTKASEILREAALANNLLDEHGEDFIQAIIAEGLTA